MNSERKRKPMTIREEYKNANVPLPNDMLNESKGEIDEVDMPTDTDTDNKLQ